MILSSQPSPTHGCRMEKFEIHITADEKIHEAITAINESFRDRKIKTIKIDLLKPDGSFLRTQHMTSFVTEHPDFGHCVVYVIGLKNVLIKHHGIKVIRTKIECPYYEHYASKSLYIESHFAAPENSPYPISRSQHKTTIGATDRLHDKSKFDDFRQKWSASTVELCLSDSNVEEDKDWFALWNSSPSRDASTDTSTNCVDGTSNEAFSTLSENASLESGKSLTKSSWMSNITQKLAIFGALRGRSQK